MASTSIVRDALKHFGGITCDNLLDLLNEIDDLDSSISMISQSPYVESENLPEYIQSFSHNFSILTLNIQSLNAKFDSFTLKDLSKHNFEFSAIYAYRKPG